MQVAETIAVQLGGSVNRIAAMVGGTLFSGSENSLSFRFAAKAKNKANHVVVELAGDDTYTVKFWRISRRAVDCVEVGSSSAVYAEQLREHFERETGLSLSL